MILMYDEKDVWKLACFHENCSRNQGAIILIVVTSRLLPYLQCRLNSFKSDLTHV
jgi:hypothetical protein